MSNIDVVNISSFCQLSENEIEGRIVLASQDIDAGEMIFSENPVVKYPQWKTVPLCLGCYNSIEYSQCIQCKICNWPMCSEDCCQTEDHLLECGIFQKIGIKIDMDQLKFDKKSQNVVPLYDVISILRMIALRFKEDKHSWEQVNSLMSHREEWEKNPTWKEQHQHAFDYILQSMKLPNVDEELILKLLGIAYTNDTAASIPGSDIKIRLAFPTSAMFSHDCLPNVVRHIGRKKDGFQLKGYAARNIKKGEKLSISYVDLLLPTSIRQEILRKSKHFECLCTRCKDATELGSHGSSIRCGECQKGFLIPSKWECNKCGYEIPDEIGKSVLFKAYKESEELISIKSNRTVEKYEAYIEKYQKTLHPDNLCLVRIKYNLVGYYGRMKGYCYPDFIAKPILFTKKIVFAEQILSVLNKIEPGISSSKGVIYYEMHMPIFLKAQMNLSRKSIDAKEAKTEFRKSIDCLQKSMEHLKYNSKETYGNQLFIGAQDTLKQLKKFVK